MAVMHIEHRANSITRSASFVLILPEKLPEQFTKGNPHYDRPVKTVEILHGYTASRTEWLYNAPLMQLSMEYNLAFVLPDGNISFYLDREPTGNSYARYVGEELPRYLQDTFRIAMNREDTLIAGESMGGFGALHTGLLYPETFSGIMALSSALIVHQVAEMTHEVPDQGMANYEYYEEIFGDPDKVLAGVNNPETLVKNLKASGAAFPEIYMACGTEDFLLERNRQFRDFLTAQGVKFRYEEAPGVHNFEFWNRKFRPGLEYLLGLEK